MSESQASTGSVSEIRSPISATQRHHLTLGLESESALLYGLNLQNFSG
jgi:hypothetical protein